MSRLNYIGVIIGVTIGLISLFMNTGTDFWCNLAIPLGMIGWAIGGLLEKYFKT